ncbi:beta-lactamase class A [Devosia sp. UYZn731]|uniref:class A beta-lactamase n=1 Tax=Devosia sp. UYZn731 TaxID=3156345 RepID=UPI00339577FB
MNFSLPVFVFAFFLSTAVQADDHLADVARGIETRLGAEVGFAILDTADDSWSLYKADQRFPMASTFKVLACAALLKSNIADAPIMRVGELQTYSPVTKDLVGQSVSPYQLCDATMRTSDNTAANLVLEAIGGPQAVTQFVRDLGDFTTRLDRWEPDLNEASLGDDRDTSTPRAFATTLRALVLGDALAASKRNMLNSWMRSNEVGGPLLRASIPDHWTIGDRTGAGGNGTRGIVAVLWPGDAAPIVTAIFITQTDASMDDRNEAIAELGRAIVARRDQP